MKKIKHERGQSLVELAVSLLVLLYLLSGAVEFGIAFFQFVQLRDAAQEGALYGSMNPTDTSGITARVQGASNSPIDLTTITVTLTYNHVVFMPFMSRFVGNTIPLHATVTDTILSPTCS